MIEVHLIPPIIIFICIYPIYITVVNKDFGAMQLVTVSYAFYGGEFKNHIHFCWLALLFEIYAAMQIRAGQRSLTANLWPLTAHIYHVMIMVTGGFSKKSIFVIFRSSRTQMFFKTGVIWNFAIFTGKHLYWVSFL